MSKVGILSLPLTWNYGGILQQYALSEYLKKNQLKPLLFSRRLDRKNLLTLPLVKLKWNSIHYLGKFELLKFIPLIATEKFKQKYLNRSKDLYSSVEIKNCANKKKIKNFIVGSDQIWNVESTPSLSDSFFGFVDQRNFGTIAAYGPSFAHDDWKYSKTQTKLCKNLIKKFFLISVREKQGIKLTKKYLNKKSIRVLDPTFLLEKKDYLKLIKKKLIKKNQTLFSYILDNNLEKKEFINRIVEEKKLKLVNYSNFSTKSNIFNLKKKDYSVQSWLYNISSAEFVITDSFHGMALSIIFKKNFLIFLNKKRGSSRFTSLLSDLGLEKRVINNLNFKESDFSEINWNSVNNKLKKLKLKSRNFLKKIILKIKRDEKLMEIK